MTSRFFRGIAILSIVTVAVLVVTSVAVGHTFGHPQKLHLDRDDIYYQIENDAGDHGNYIETYHLPDGKGGKVYCIVYSDQIQKSGGGAGISCDWKGLGGDGG